MNQTEVSGLLCVGMHEMDGGEESYAAECSKMNQDKSHETTKFDVVMATSAMYTDHGNTNATLDEYHMSRIQHLEEIRFGSTQHFELQPVRMVADSEEESSSSSSGTSSTTNYDMPGYMEQNVQHIYTSLDAMVDKDGPVMLSPDFIMCDGTSHLEPHFTFSSDGIEIEYFDLDSCEMIALHWKISNIISIICKWAQSVGSAFVTFLAGSEAEIGNSGPVRVQFCLDDPQWPRKQQKIWHLAARYQEIWKDVPSDDIASDNWSIEPSCFFPRQYFLSTEDFEDVIYPKGDPDAVSISKRDAELLLPETFVNDTIIDFYVKYLSTRTEPTEKRRYHFFNSFFFRKLADLDKDQGRAPEGRAAFLRVRKWTRKINVFEKDFLFIPVNFNLHWSLIVICYPGEVATFKDGDTEVSDKVPCILHMDSLKGSHNGLKDIIQSYLWEEWKERNPESASDNSDKFLNLRFVSLELPQQDNSFDCGLFLLHYVELFLMDAPSIFNPFKIDVFNNFLSDDWFPPAQASLKRSVVQKLIHELVAGSFQNHPMLVCSNVQLDKGHQRSENVDREPTAEFLAQRCSVGEPDSVYPIHDGTQLTQQPSTSICLNDSEENGLSASGCFLDNGKVSMVALQNLQESVVCLRDKDTVICLSSQDERNKALLEVSNNLLDMRACSAEDSSVFKESGCLVKDKYSHEESLLVSLDNNRKKSSQAVVEVHDIMVSKCCAISDDAEQVMASQEQSLERNTNEVGDECHRASQYMDSVMMPDASKDDTRPHPEKTTCKIEDGHDLCEDTDSVTLGAIDKDVAEPCLERSTVEVEDTKREHGLVDPIAVKDGINDNTQEISTTADNVNHSEQYVSPELEERNTDNCMVGNTSELKVRNTDNGTTGSTISSELKDEKTDNGMTRYSSELKVGNADDSTTGGGTVSSELKEGNTDHVMAADCTDETNVNTDGDDTCDDGAVPCEDDTTFTCTDAAIPLVHRPCSAENETISENTTSDAKRPLPDGTCGVKNINFSDDKCIQKVDAQGTEPKIERHYKRRKVLAAELEKQQSFSGVSSLD
ncbi:probable ubiquitin-like-specific protease 2B [Phragmites australis]|uniref:probable ubiquitin-like-specific protease 2B n=1 Tax=Phragmites australis TaxID=29695 RepID=UPI002D78F855|nr:probable ubiquitin-like-specific protease 2B [Phragmites australis]XP_062203174.1 probable ubiquitin-like-specific protease 2B [Phragmites australis]